MRVENRRMAGVCLSDVLLPQKTMESGIIHHMLRKSSEKTAVVKLLVEVVLRCTKSKFIQENMRCNNPWRLGAIIHGKTLMETNQNQTVLSRISHLERIINALELTGQSYPTSDQEKLYREALSRVACSLSHTCRGTVKMTYGEIAHQVPKSNQCPNSISEEEARKQFLKRSCSLLLEMKRKRLYAPPTNDEVGHYIAIKKHIRVLKAFHVAQRNQECTRIYCDDAIFSNFGLLWFGEEIAEITSIIRDFSSSASMNDFKIAIKPTISLETIPVATCGDEKKGNMFYRHKFVLAFLDLCDSHLGNFAPMPDEEKCYTNIMNLFEAAPSKRDATGGSVHLEDIVYFSADMIFGELITMEKHTRCFLRTILDNLPFDKRTLEDILYDTNGLYSALRRELPAKWEPSASEDLQCWINDLQQCLLLAKSTANLICAATRKAPYIYKSLANSAEDGSLAEKFGWEALVVPNLLKSTSDCHVGGETTSEENNLAFKENENVKLISNLVEDFERIVGSHAYATPLDDEESEVINKIWEIVAADVYFYTYATVYAQKSRSALHCGATPFGLTKERPAKKMRNNEGCELLKGYNLLLSFGVFLGDVIILLDECREYLIERIGG